MTPILTIFAVQFIYVLLLGLQSRIVNWGGKRYAMLTSACLGTFGLLANESIARNAMMSGNDWFRAAYILAGPLAIASAMWLHDRWGNKS